MYSSRNGTGVRSPPFIVQRIPLSSVQIYIMPAIKTRQAVIVVRRPFFMLFGLMN